MDFEERLRRLEAQMADIMESRQFTYGVYPNIATSFTWLKCVDGDFYYPLALNHQPTDIVNLGLGTNLLAFPAYFPSGDARLDKMGIYCSIAGAAGAKARFYIYESRLNPIYPGRLVQYVGEIDCTVTGYNVLNVQPLYTPRGLFWIAIQQTAHGQGFYHIARPVWRPLGEGAVGHVGYSCYAAANTYGTTPDPYPSGAAKSGSSPAVYVSFTP